MRGSVSICVLVFALFIPQQSRQTEVLSNDKDICRLFQDGVKLRKPGYCNEIIECVNHESVSSTVCSGTKKYATTKGTCASTVDAYCKAPCKATSPTFVTDPKNCEGWYRCNKATEEMSGYCPNSMHFSDAKQACIYSSESTCKATYSVCDVAPSSTPYKDEESCNKYYQCSDKGTNPETSYTCPTGQYFDVDSAACVPKNQVKCDKVPYPENVCGTTKLAKRNVFVNDGATCRGYFFCKDLGSGKPDPEPVWGQCDPDKFFDENLQICLTRTYVSCNEDRCDGRDSGKELSSKRGCQSFLNCQNNVTLSEEACAAGLYFDPLAEDCVSTTITYPIC